MVDSSHRIVLHEAKNTFLWWVIPFFVLLRMPIRKFAALIIGDTVVYIAIFTMFLHFDDGRFDEFYNYVAVGVVLRTLALAWLLVGVFKARRGERRVAPAPTPVLFRSSAKDRAPAGPADVSDTN